MLEGYQNKVCVVTGAASGIGKALCEKLVALGAQPLLKQTCPIKGALMRPLAFCRR